MTQPNGDASFLRVSPSIVSFVIACIVGLSSIIGGFVGLNVKIQTMQDQIDTLKEKSSDQRSFHDDTIREIGNLKGDVKELNGNVKTLTTLLNADSVKPKSR